MEKTEVASFGAASKIVFEKLRKTMKTAQDKWSSTDET
jgi:hypothetical protein